MPSARASLVKNGLVNEVKFPGLTIFIQIKRMMQSSARNSNLGIYG